MMKRPQFFIDIERELAGELDLEPEKVEPEPAGPQVHVEAVTRVFYQDAEYRAQHAAIARYYENATATGAMIAAQEQAEISQMMARQARSWPSSIAVMDQSGLMPILNSLGIVGGLFRK